MVWLDTARVVAIFAVVVLHVAANVVVHEPVGSSNWWVGNIYDSLVRWCVPVFVMVSGALLLDRNKLENTKDFYIKRASRVAIPLVIWSLIFFLWRYFESNIEGGQTRFKDLAFSITQGTPYYRLWFLFMIIFIYIFTPFFGKITFNSSIRELKLIVAISLLLVMLNALSKVFGFASSNVFLTLFLAFFLSYVPYFFLGYLIKISKINLKWAILWGGFIVTVLTTSAGCYLVADTKDLAHGLYFYDYLSVTVVPMSFFVICLFKKWSRGIWNDEFTKRVASLTLEIYVIHPIILGVINHEVGILKAVNPLISIPLTAVIVFSLSLLAALAISKMRAIRKTI
ncbi:acyltransferase [Paraburkholderia mimosarum]|uniref:acyltransferase n=1 Tax=Paraburkholderia mimosarum TaxID=312026 RepID=UPI001379114F|nr:acyltransferase family protein [Paraburkholderia mimosarum]